MCLENLFSVFFTGCATNNDTLTVQAALLNHANANTAYSGLFHFVLFVMDRAACILLFAGIFPNQSPLVYLPVVNSGKFVFVLHYLCSLAVISLIL